MSVFMSGGAGDTYTRDETLTAATSALYGLDDSAAPDDVLAAARALISTAQSAADAAQTTANSGVSAASAAQATANNAVNAASAAQSTANTKAKIETGSYVGTGTSGTSAPNSLIFSGNPEFVIIQNTNTVYGTTVIFLRGSPAAYSLVGINTGIPLTVSWGTNSMAWYVDSNDAGRHSVQQLNESGSTYLWVAVF